MTIFWTKRAKARFLEIVNYLTTKFGSKSAEKFKSKVLHCITLLEEFPELGSLEVPDKKIHGFQLTKQTRIFYRIAKRRIILLTFFDTRQNPANRPK